MKPLGNENSNTGSKLDALRKRAGQLEALIAAEKLKQQKREAVNRKRLASIIGEALVGYAEQSPDFKLMLKQVLASAAMDDAARKFLAGKGWV